MKYDPVLGNNKKNKLIDFVILLFIIVVLGFVLVIHLQDSIRKERTIRYKKERAIRLMQAELKARYSEDARLLNQMNKKKITAKQACNYYRKDPVCEYVFDKELGNEN